MIYLIKKKTVFNTCSLWNIVCSSLLQDKPFDATGKSSLLTSRLPSKQYKLPTLSSVFSGGLNNDDPKSN